MKTLRHIFVLALIGMSTFVFANNNATNNSTKNNETETTTAKSKKTIYDKAPVMDKKVCDLKLTFDTQVEGTTVNFNNESVGNYTNIEWTFGDGASSTAKNPTHTYHTEGVYYYTATLYNADNGCVDFLAGNYYVGTKKVAETNHSLTK